MRNHQIAHRRELDDPAGVHIRAAQEGQLRPSEDGGRVMGEDLHVHLA